MAFRRGVTDLEQIDGGGTSPGEMEILEVGEERALALPEPTGIPEVPEEEGIDVMFATEEEAQEARAGGERRRIFAPRRAPRALPSGIRGATGLTMAEGFPPARGEEPIQAEYGETVRGPARGITAFLDRLRREAAKATPGAAPSDRQALVEARISAPVRPSRLIEVMGATRDFKERMAKGREAAAKRGIEERAALAEQALAEFYATSRFPGFLARQRAYPRFTEIQRARRLGARAASLQAGVLPLTRRSADIESERRRFAQARTQQVIAGTRLQRALIERQALARLDPSQLVPVRGPRGAIGFRYQPGFGPMGAAFPASPGTRAAMNIWGSSQRYYAPPPGVRTQDAAMDAAMRIFGGGRPQAAPPPEYYPPAYGGRQAQPEELAGSPPPPPGYSINPEAYELVRTHWRAKRPDKLAKQRRGFGFNGGY